MIAAATALVLWSGLLHPWTRDARVERSKPAAGWTLEVRHDTFTGATKCVVKARDMVYRHGVLTFRFDSSIDTANALYRLDQGAVQPAGLVATEAAGLGAQFRSQNMKNPSNGRVHIPTAHLQEAQTVTIRPNGHRRTKTFRLTGFGDVLAAAKAKGCDVVSPLPASYPEPHLFSATKRALKATPVGKWGE